MRGAAFVIALLLFASGCSVSVIHGDEQKAIDIANLFLQNLMKEDYKDAYNDQLGEPWKEVQSPGEFERMFRQSQQDNGQLVKASFDYFLPQGQKIALFYNVSHKKAGIVSYRFILEGDASKGYGIYRLDVGTEEQQRSGIIISGDKMGKKIFAEVTASGIKKGKR